jgi:hypothetical protein
MKIMTNIISGRHQKTRRVKPGALSFGNLAFREDPVEKLGILGSLATMLPAIFNYYSENFLKIPARPYFMREEHLETNSLDRGAAPIGQN